MIDIIVLFTFLAWIIFIVALWKENSWLSFLAGILILILGMYVLTYGVQDVNNTLTRMFSVVNLGIGMYIVLVSSFEAIET